MKYAQFFFNLIIVFCILNLFPSAATAGFWIGAVLVTILAAGNYFFGTRWND